MSRLVILMYHIVDQPRSESEARYCCLPEQFDAQMQWLAGSGLPLVSLDQLADCRINDNPWPDTGIAVTFDDGFADFHTHAVASLERYAIPATMFVVTNRFGGDNDWMHTRGFPHRDLMSLQQLREIESRGVTLGTHTCNHVKLSEVDASLLEPEIAGSKVALEDALGHEVRHFAYPYGLYNDAARDAVEAAGYATACTTRSGFNRGDIDPFQLRRLEVYGSDSLAQFRRKISFGVNNMPWYFPARYYLGQVGRRMGIG